ncbi:MAG: cytochrome c biogenesis heme-transporting ATPase CcmA [Gammaproteobacteria bacterium]|nr:cytochrome c biogenesis heme-transporting ATPase CcmA [Gammaproteobacteria bacterium]
MSESGNLLLLETRQLECVRDDRLLFRDLSFTLAAGEILQIEGANGSGKTSLLRILCGLRLAEAGQVLWQGEDVSEVREDYYANMIYIGHLPCIKGDLTTLENIRSLLDTRSQSVPLDEIELALTKVGLAGFDDVVAKALSSGQRRRILLAFLLLSKTKLWIMDEPLTALDVHGVALVESMLMEHREAGGSAIFTTHHGMKLPCEMRSVTLGGKC